MAGREPRETVPFGGNAAAATAERDGATTAAVAADGEEAVAVLTTGGLIAGLSFEWRVLGCPAHARSTHHTHTHTINTPLTLYAKPCNAPQEQRYLSVTSHFFAFGQSKQ